MAEERRSTLVTVTQAPAQSLHAGLLRRLSRRWMVDDEQGDRGSGKQAGRRVSGSVRMAEESDQSFEIQHWAVEMADAMSMRV